MLIIKFFKWEFFIEIIIIKYWYSDFNKLYIIYIDKIPVSGYGERCVENLSLKRT